MPAVGVKRSALRSSRSKSILVWCTSRFSAWASLGAFAVVFLNPGVAIGQPSSAWTHAACAAALDAVSVTSALASLRRELSAPADASVLTPSAVPVRGAGCVVFLSVRGAGSAAQPRVVAGRGADWTSALGHAAAAIRGHVAAAEMSDTLILVDVVERVGALDHPQLSALPRGLFGLAEDSPGGRFLLPAEILAHRIFDSRRRFRRERLAEFEQRFPERSGQSPPEWTWLFTTRSFADDGSSVYELFRGHSRTISLSPADLRASAVRAAAYLSSAVGVDGRFDYEYLPKSDRSDDGYNLLRHAGAIYALLEVHHETSDAALLASAERALEYLARQIKPCPLAQSGLCPVEADEVKLGGNGLAVLALLQHPDIAQRERWSALAVGLGERILDLLQPNGSFRPHKVRWSTGVPSRFESEYYPGEAIFALTRLHRQTGEERWLGAARRAASHRVSLALSAHQRSEGARMVHDHWLAYGLAELAVLRPEANDSLYLQRLARSIAAAQHRSDDSLPPDWTGGFSSPPRAAPAATRAEALTAIARAMFHEPAPDSVPNVEEAEAMEDLRGDLSEVLCSAAAFQMRAQFTPERAFYLPDPQRALGGVSRSLTDYGLRIDYSQHAISNWLALATLQRERRLTCPTSVELPQGEWLPQPEAVAPAPSQLVERVR